MSARDSGISVSKVPVMVSFATIYLIWGSTYLAIRFAVETLPPFTMMAVRFVIGGALFFLISRMRKEAGATREQVSWASLIGVMLLCGATGVVGWAEQVVPSGLTALLVAGSPLWFTLIDWLRPGGMKPTRATVLGLVVGVIGIIILIGPDKIQEGGAVHLLGAGALLFASFSWASGSILSQHVSLPKSPMLTASVELLAGGLACAVFGVVTGEWSRVVWNAISLKSVLAMGYLTIFGAVAYMAFVYLLRVSTPAKVSTYAYINPIVAVVLGATLGGEELTLRILTASVVIIGAVGLITMVKSRKVESKESVTQLSPEVEAN